MKIFLFLNRLLEVYKIYNDNAIDMKSIKEFHSWKEPSINKNNVYIVHKLVEKFFKE